MSGYRRPTAWRLLCVLLLCLGSVPSLASNVRSTKSYDFKETDGSASGFIMFNLDKIHPSEVFKIESPNRWVSVDTTGAVRVKDPWDYEQLGKEKTIDFWVIITSPNLNDINDENPYFINRPLPMQTVVQLNAPAGTPVFKLQARDPDTDHNIHYFLVRDRNDRLIDWCVLLSVRLEQAGRK
ncbi:hypothetical protein L1887_62327 [Cichorium endivia]|nr:hypothetical protein L1887_62327 [Cichorium endivia]